MNLSYQLIKNISKLKCLFVVTVLTAPLPSLAKEANNTNFDQAAAQALFNTRCQACHFVENADGQLLAGIKTRNGPNLYALESQGFAADKAYRRYGASLKAGKEAGLKWNLPDLTAYLLKPKGFLEQKLNIEKANSRMAFYLQKQDEAELIAKYLLTFSDANAAQQ